MTSLGWNALRHTQSYTYIFVLFPAHFRQCAHQYECPKNWNSLQLIWKQIRNHNFSQPLLLLRFFKWNIKTNAETNKLQKMQSCSCHPYRREWQHHSWKSKSSNSIKVPWLHGAGTYCTSPQQEQIPTQPRAGVWKRQGKCCFLILKQMSKASKKLCALSKNMEEG